MHGQSDMLSILHYRVAQYSVCSSIIIQVRILR